MRTVILVGFWHLSDAVSMGQFREPHNIMTLEAVIFFVAMVMDIGDFIRPRCKNDSI